MGNKMYYLLLFNRKVDFVIIDELQTMSDGTIFDFLKILGVGYSQKVLA
jgi:hypothetical protein